MDTPRLTTPQPARHSTPTAKATSLAYIRWERPDLEKAEQFLQDFGLRTVSRTKTDLYLSSSDGTPWCYHISKSKEARFVGMGFSVSNRSELQALSALPGASDIEKLNEPGHGEVVRLTDPGGLRVDIVHGREQHPKTTHRAPLPVNYNSSSLSRINGTQRAPANPPDILKLGHVAMEVVDYQAVSAWYTQHLGFIPSDIQVLPDGSPAIAFMRLDLGDQPADHHTLALAQSFQHDLSHCAFEVIDLDAVGMGQRVLSERGWRHAWGMGRHLLGSQVFDYWSDPWGAHHEHYCDGDAFTADQPVTIHPYRRGDLAQWGQPPHLLEFVAPKANLNTIKNLLLNLRTSPEVSLEKLLYLLRSA